MGNCIGSCFWFPKRNRNYRPQRTLYFQGENMVEFDCFTDEAETPTREKPKSATVVLEQPPNRKFPRNKYVTERERQLVIQGKLHVLTDEQQKEDERKMLEQSHREVLLELEEETSIQWTPKSEELLDNEVHIQPLDARSLAARALLQTQGSLSSGASFPRRDRFATMSTPPSSLDLEWENEELPDQATELNSGTEDDLLSLDRTVDSSAMLRSRTSTPNSLEWDNCGEDTFGSEIDVETEQLICEIERLTSRALRETGQTLMQNSR